MQQIRNEKKKKPPRETSGLDNDAKLRKSNTTPRDLERERKALGVGYSEFSQVNIAERTCEMASGRPKADEGKKIIQGVKADEKEDGVNQGFPFLRKRGTEDEPAAAAAAARGVDDGDAVMWLWL